MAIGGVSLVLPGLFGGQLSGRVVTTLPSICLEKTRQSVAIHPTPDKSETVTIVETVTVDLPPDNTGTVDNTVTVAVHLPPDNTGTVTGVFYFILQRYQRKLRYRCGVFSS